MTSDREGMRPHRTPRPRYLVLPFLAVLAAHGAAASQPLPECICPPDAQTAKTPALHRDSGHLILIEVSADAVRTDNEPGFFSNWTRCKSGDWDVLVENSIDDFGFERPDRRCVVPIVGMRAYAERKAGVRGTSITFTIFGYSTLSPRMSLTVGDADELRACALARRIVDSVRLIGDLSKFDLLIVALDRSFFQFRDDASVVRRGRMGDHIGCEDGKVLEIGERFVKLAEIRANGQGGLVEVVTVLEVK